LRTPSAMSFFNCRATFSISADADRREDARRYADLSSGHTKFIVELGTDCQGLCVNTDSGNPRGRDLFGYISACYSNYSNGV
jgi:hypothetical protein